MCGVTCKVGKIRNEHTGGTTKLEKYLTEIGQGDGQGNME